jgi:outer membrane protein assembly factor BamB
LPSGQTHSLATAKNPDYNSSAVFGLGTEMLARRALFSLFCWFAGTLISFNVAFAAPAITVSPAAGPPTTTIAVSGTGFGANAAVDIYFDLTDLCLALASDIGAFSCVISAPKDAQPQTHWISAVQRNTGTGSQKPFVVRTDWGQFHGQNAKHTGFNQYENTITTANVANLDILWQAPIGPTGTWSTPAVGGGKVFIPGLDGNLYSFFSKTGAPIPGFPKVLGGPVQDSSAIIGGANIYVGTVFPDDKLYAFNVSTGAPVAGFPVSVGGNITGSPTYHAGKIYVACADGKLYAFNATTGAAIAGFPVTVGGGAALFSTVSIANDRALVGSSDGNLYAYDATTGAPIAGYPRNASGGVRGAPAVVSGQVFFTSAAASGIWGLRARDARLLSGFPVAVAPEDSASVAVGNSQLVAKVSTASPALRSYTTTGSLRWNFSFPDAQERGSPILANGIAYVGGRDTLWALDAATGAVLWRGAVSQSHSASPVVADGILYIGSDDGTLYAFTVNGVTPMSRLPGGELGVKPALSSLKPNYALKPVRQ